MGKPENPTDMILFKGDGDNGVVTSLTSTGHHKPADSAEQLLVDWTSVRGDGDSYNFTLKRPLDMGNNEYYVVPLDTEI